MLPPVKEVPGSLPSPKTLAESSLSTLSSSSLQSANDFVTEEPATKELATVYHSADSVSSTATAVAADAPDNQAAAAPTEDLAKTLESQHDGACAPPEPAAVPSCHGVAEKLAPVVGVGASFEPQPEPLKPPHRPASPADLPGESAAVISDVRTQNINCASSTVALKPWSPRGSGLVGLSNLGNTCYMNSAIQMLSSNPIFSDFLLLFHSYSVESNSRGPPSATSCDLPLASSSSGDGTDFFDSESLDQFLRLSCLEVACQNVNSASSMDHESEPGQSKSLSRHFAVPFHTLSSPLLSQKGTMIEGFATLVNNLWKESTNTSLGPGKKAVHISTLCASSDVAGAEVVARAALGSPEIKSDLENSVGVVIASQNVKIVEEHVASNSDAVQTVGNDEVAKSESSAAVFSSLNSFQLNKQKALGDTDDENIIHSTPNLAESQFCSQDIIKYNSELALATTSCADITTENGLDETNFSSKSKKMPNHVSWKEPCVVTSPMSPSFLQDDPKGFHGLPFAEADAQGKKNLSTFLGILKRKVEKNASSSEATASACKKGTSNNVQSPMLSFFRARAGKLSVSFQNILGKDSDATLAEQKNKARSCDGNLASSVNSAAATQITQGISESNTGPPISSNSASEDNAGLSAARTGEEISQLHSLIPRSFAQQRGERKYINPRNFHRLLCKKFDVFEGREQHDSQELLNCVLDNLHEELNIISKKPIMHYPDDVSSYSAVELADLWWANHTARENSPIVAVFQGQFQSILTCSRCSYIAPSFPAFLFVAPCLRLDGFRYQRMYVTLYGERAVEFRLRMPLDCTVVDLLSRLRELDTEAFKGRRFELCRVRDRGIAAVLPPYKSLMDLAEKDIVACFELPPNQNLCNGVLTTSTGVEQISTNISANCSGGSLTASQNTEIVNQQTTDNDNSIFQFDVKASLQRRTPLSGPYYFFVHRKMLEEWRLYGKRSAKATIFGAPMMMPIPPADAALITVYDLYYWVYINNVILYDINVSDTLMPQERKKSKKEKTAPKVKKDFQVTLGKNLNLKPDSLKATIDCNKTETGPCENELSNLSESPENQSVSDPSNSGNQPAREDLNETDCVLEIEKPAQNNVAKTLDLFKFGQKTAPRKGSYPYVLRIVNRTGLRCALCPANSSCAGCIMKPSGRAVPIPPGSCIAIDWLRNSKTADIFSVPCSPKFYERPGFSLAMASSFLSTPIIGPFFKKANSLKNMLAASYANHAQNPSSTGDAENNIMITPPLAAGTEADTVIPATDEICGNSTEKSTGPKKTISLVAENSHEDCTNPASASPTFAEMEEDQARPKMELKPGKDGTENVKTQNSSPPETPLSRVVPLKFEPVTVEDMLRDFVAPEELPDLKCSKCKCIGHMRKTETIHRAPPVLLIHVKRFSYNQRGTSKNKREIKILSPVLDLAPFLSKSSRGKDLPSRSSGSPKCETGNAAGKCEYELVSIINHIGDHSSGHYVAHGRGADGNWYLFDDDCVSPKPVSFPLTTPFAYVLCYVRRGASLGDILVSWDAEQQRIAPIRQYEPKST